MPKKGETRPLVAVTREIDEALKLLAECGERTFRVKDVVELSRKTGEQVRVVLCLSTQAGCLKRVARGVYEFSDKEAKRHLPSSFVAEKVWKVLSEAKQALSPREITAMAEKLAGEGICLRSSVGSLLSTWRRLGYLERFGERFNYSYSVLPGISSRPPQEHQ